MDSSGFICSSDRVLFLFDRVTIALGKVVRTDTLEAILEFREQIRQNK